MPHAFLNESLKKIFQAAERVKDVYLLTKKNQSKNLRFRIDLVRKVKRLAIKQRCIGQSKVKARRKHMLSYAPSTADGHIKRH